VRHIAAVEPSDYDDLDGHLSQLKGTMNAFGMILAISPLFDLANYSEPLEVASIHKYQHDFMDKTPIMNLGPCADSSTVGSEPVSSRSSPPMPLWIINSVRVFRFPELKERLVKLAVHFNIRFSELFGLIGSDPRSI
jgi:hypothetical protein